MTKHYLTNLLSVATLLLLLATAMPSFAQEDDAPSGEPTAPESFLPTLPKNDNGYYVIETADDYETFRQIVATGNPYANAILTDNITVSNPIGSGAEQFHYRGTFDGQGHTVTLDMDNTDDDAMTVGLFHFTKPGCVIRNLHVSGKVYANDSRPHTGTIIADATGTIIENCISDAKIYGESKRGGLVGIARGKCMLENCAFVGEMPGGTARSGLVGENSQSLSIKSCYASPKFTSYMPGDELPNLFTNRMESYEEKVTGETEVVYQTSLNNYFNYNYQRATTFEHINRDPAYANKVTDDDVSSGKLCYMLNVNGKKGVVWYQKDGLPYPFPVEGGQLVHSPFDDIIVQGGECNHRYMVNDHCSHCGYISGTVEPLQRRLGYYIDDVWYSYDDDNMTATVAGLLSDVKAVHIPETITYMDNMANIKTYRVTEIASQAFANTQIEYCYIPKSVTNISNSAFIGCTNLKYVHIADGTAGQEALQIGDGVFASCISLKKIYIGRDLMWSTDTERPFGVNSIAEMYWGPGVSYVGNVNNKNARDYYYYLNGDNAIQKVYLMGNDETLNCDLDVCNRSDLSKARDYYVNRNIKGRYISSTTNNGGLLDGCESIAYGPYVKSIVMNSFLGLDSNPKPLKSLDFSNAFNLETIEGYAFFNCTNLETGLDLTTTKVKSIEESSFQNSSIKSVTFGNQLETIKPFAFKGCTSLKGTLDLTATKLTAIAQEVFAQCEGIQSVVLSNQLTTIGASSFYGCKNLGSLYIPCSVTTIGFNAFASCERLNKVFFEDSDTPLDLKNYQFYNSNNIGNIYLGRTIVADNSSSFIPKSSSSWTIGPKVEKLYKAHFAQNQYDEIFIMGSETQTALLFDGYFDSGVITLSVDRILKCEQDGKEVIPFARKADIKFLNFGEHISSISANMFEGCTNIGFVMIPMNITNIGDEALKGCGMQLVCIMGDAEVGKSAFANCTNLQYLYFMGQSATLDEGAFAGNNNLKEVTVLFQKDPEVESSPNAFDGKAYDDVHLVSTESLNFTSDPWRKFQKLGSAYPTSVFTGTPEQYEGGIFDRATLSHKLPVGKFELVSVPFVMDSYYFGVDAEIYSLKTYEGNNMWDTYTSASEELPYNIDDIEFVKVDIDEEKTLRPYRTYLVKVNHEEESLSTYYSLFEENGTSFDNRITYLRSISYDGASILTGQLESVLEQNRYLYVNDNGVIKRYNGGDEYKYQQGGVMIDSDFKPMVLNLKSDDGQVLMSSKIDIPFNSLLEGYASFYAADYNYIAPDWCDVYIVTSAEEGSSVTLEKIEDRTIPKGEAVLLKSNNEGKLADGLTEYLTYATNGSRYSYAGNLLKGVDVETPVSDLGREFVYVLSRTSGNSTGFYKYKKSLQAGKAYLDPEGLSHEQLAKSCLFTLKDTVSGIKSRSESMSESDAIYDLMGRRLKEAGFKGIYIVNGKKVVIK